MVVVRLSADQAREIATWSVEGPEFAPLVVHDHPPPQGRRCRERDVLVTQSDESLHLACTEQATESVPPATLEHR